ncbi:head-tail adaptor protein [Pararhodobacter zhoushanensis]|uniref:head-tail adaptor protein n=1 Tax=Pararhodobacter zhoushanensis TaxID=2479545 RepID=UPI000F8C6641|nr:head-tail adaptor protein [Pararhodobacter zhoushanensis]
MTSAGQLDQEVQFLRASKTDNGVEQVETFTALGDPVWAERVYASDGEKWRAQQVQAQISARFKLWSSAFSRGLTLKDRLSCGGELYDITGIKPVGNNLDFIEISAVARAVENV